MAALTLAVISLGTLCLRQVASLPISQPTVSIDKRSVKRYESGPLDGGANFPDPSVIEVNGQWYSFATRTIGSSIHIQVAQSSDFSTWTTVKNADGSQLDALPTLPSWVEASSPNTWAPDVVQLDDGSFVMYYSATTTSDTSKHCVGAATSSTVLGPYTPQPDTVACPLSEGGAIDASGYNDNGQRYVVYKVDGNSIGHGGACGNTVAPIVATPIVLQAVASDGVTLQGSPVTIFNNDGASDDGIVEAPSLVNGPGGFVLFFSSGCYTTGDYTVSYASSSAITGPYTRAAEPLFKTGDLGLTAPGGGDIYLDGQHLLFHANYGSGRALYEAVVTISSDSVTV